MQPLTLRELHAALLDILSEFDRICTQHGLRYTLAYGTLLGAVRHKGFIPWDDDADVCMPRPDYEKLRTLILDGTIQLGEHFLLADDRGKHAEYPFLKLMDDRYRIKSRTHREVKYLYLDIFPVDGFPEKKGKALHRKLMVLDFCVDMTRWYVLDKWWCYVLRVVCFWFYLPFLIWGRRHIVAKINRIAAQYPYETHELVDCTVWGATSYEIPKRYYDSFCTLEFEGRQFQAIAEWDSYLINRYGDYMTPPPLKKRETHGLKVYKTQE